MWGGREAGGAGKLGNRRLLLVLLYLPSLLLLLHQQLLQKHLVVPPLVQVRQLFQVALRVLKLLRLLHMLRQVLRMVLHGRPQVPQRQLCQAWRQAQRRLTEVPPVLVRHRDP